MCECLQISCEWRESVWLTRIGAQQYVVKSVRFNSSLQNCMGDDLQIIVRHNSKFTTTVLSINLRQTNRWPLMSRMFCIFCLRNNEKLGISSTDFLRNCVILSKIPVKILSKLGPIDSTICHTVWNVKLASNWMGSIDNNQNCPRGHGEHNIDVPSKGNTICILNLTLIPTLTYYFDSTSSCWTFTFPTKHTLLAGPSFSCSFSLFIW